MENNQHLLLKWGTLKGWDVSGNDECIKLITEYIELGASVSAMTQRDTPRQKEIVLELIDKIDGPITNDWSGDDYTKEKAKDYIMNYGTKY